MREFTSAHQGFTRRQLLKVAGQAEFAGGQFPMQSLLLDCRGAAPESLPRGWFDLPVAGFLVDPGAAVPAGVPWIQAQPDDATVGDVIEVEPGRERLRVVYRRGDTGNVLFATERCNNLCLMCSQPPRDVQDDWRAADMKALVDLIDPSEPTLGITGGEPTLLGDALVDVLAYAAERLPETHIHILSNGRAFADPEFAAKFSGVHPRVSWGIPLYGDTYAVHDYVVQAKGAFSETLRGLYALHEAGQRVEVRIVLVRPTVKRLPELARFIAYNLPFVDHVALMGIEPIGFAKAHRDALWIDPADAAAALEHAVSTLARHRMNASLYNLPLCALPRSLWPFARRSISTWKQGYQAACGSCAVREACGGFFQWLTPAWTSRAIAPVAQETCDA
jgi:His-Xaa-Ser system radical SAM maturase HxsC